MSKLWRNIVSLVASLTIAEGVGLIASLLSGNIEQMYQSLIKPPLAPPDWLFPAVWVILYGLMAVAAWLVYKEEADPQEKYFALRGYWMQLLINFVWPIIFFRFGALWAAAWMLAGLIFLVWDCFLRFQNIKPWAGYLLIPYIVWLLFALYLNVSIAILN